MIPNSKCAFLLLAMACTHMASTAQNTIIHDNDTWHEGYVNSLFNISYTSLNPTRLAHNAQRDAGNAMVSYGLTRGCLHAIDAPQRVNDLNVYIGGLKHLGRIDLQGHLQYTNRSTRGQRWNATLFLHPDNPFILADSVASDGNLETFQMQAAMSYAFSPKLKGALQAALQLGSASDQTDPRPKTNTSVFPITAGIEYSASKAWSLGASAEVRLLSSRMSYTVVNPLQSHRYFLMKGMGDYFRRSTSDESGYQRDYKGTTLTASVQAIYAPKGSTWQNFTELRYANGYENATDGGSAYTFKGGDFKRSGFELTNRWMYSANEQWLHQAILQASLYNTKGYWYDQKKLTDTEHGNISYYEILSKDLIHKGQKTSIELMYRIDHLRQGQRDWHATIAATLADTQLKHYCDDGLRQQKYTLLHLNANAGKAFSLGKGCLTANIEAGYTLPAANRTYATGSNVSGNDDITASYVAPQFEYVSASQLRLGALADYTFPLNARTRLGVFAQAQSAMHSGAADYDATMKSGHRTTATLGVHIQF